MAPKTLWFDIFYNGRQVKNFYVDKVMVKSVRTEKNHPPIFFKDKDQPIANHPIIKNFMKTEKVRFQKIKKIEITFDKQKDLDCYLDKKSSRLWFNGCYLTPTPTKSRDTVQKVAKKKIPPKTVKKTNLSPSEASKSRKSDISSSSVRESSFDLNKHMCDHGYAKFNYKKVDLYRFLNAYEKGCNKLKMTDEDKISHFFLYLDQNAKRTYMELQVYNPNSDWSEFKQQWIDYFHEQTYDRLWNHLTTRETNDNLVEFAQKKYEVLRSFFKTVSDLEIIQLINVSMPKYIQSTLMSKMFSSFPAYIKFVQEEEEKAEEETEKEDEEVDQGEDTGAENNDEKEDENAEEEDSDPNFALFDNS